MIHQIDSKNRWLLLSVTFTAKFDLVFVLTFENGKRAERKKEKEEEKEHRFFYKTVLDIFKIALRLRDQYVFM